MSDIEESFDGNLCRCTGYRPILDSAKSFSHDFICDSKLIDFSECKPYDASKMEEPKFPSRLVELSNRKESLLIEHNDITWYEPKTLDELLFIKEKFPESKLVGGNSEIGVEIKFKGMDYKHFVNISNLDEMKKIQIRDGCLEIGVNTTLTDLIDKLNMCKRERMFKSYELSVVDALLSNLRWFASRQIRNFATLAGNITTGSPISDLNPIFVCTDSTLDIFSKENGLRSVSMRKFFLAYRKIDLKPNEVALRVKVPLPRSEFEIVHAYKQAKRKDDDIACVNGCFRILLNKTNENTYEVKNLDLSFGGLAPTTIYLSKINESIRNAQFSRETLSKLEEMLLECVNLSYSVPGAMPTYRRALAASFVRKFWLHVDKNVKANLFTEKELRNIEDIEREVSSGSHDFGTSKIDPHLATTYSHMSALKQTTGVAKYVDDIPKLSKELYAYPVMSKRAHAKILSVCADKALEIKGVRAFISHKDIPHENVFGLGHDEQFLPTDTVYFYGQIIGLIVAESKNLAKKASRLVEIEYETLPAILTIEDAIEKSSFFDGYEKYIKKGQFDEKTFVIEQEKIGEEFVFEGTCRIGGQEHFYLETQGSLVIPKENDELEIIAATQNPSEIQGEIARVLGIPMNKVVCKVKRIGGGFGGKETRATLFAVINAVAAFKLNCPVRFIVDRDVDMMTSGGRHPVLANYKVRIDKQGFFKAYHLDFVANGGFSLDLSSCVLDRFQNHVDNVYNFENIKVTGRIAKTNIASNTA
jgi:xanthine dehydrogenase/oxidase